MYASTKRKTETNKLPSWKWDSAIRDAEAAHAKEVQAAQRRFRKA